MTRSRFSPRLSPSALARHTARRRPRAGEAPQPARRGLPAPPRELPRVDAALGDLPSSRVRKRSHCSLHARARCARTPIARMTAPRSPRDLHPLGQARPLPRRHAGADRRPPARRRSRLVCGGRGICSKCQVTPAYGEFPKHGVTVAADALSPWNAVEERYEPHARPGPRPPPRLPGRSSMGDVVIDVPPESQVHKQVVRKRAEAAPDRDGPRHPALFRRGGRARHARALRRPASAWSARSPSSGASPTSRATCAPCRCCSRRCARATGRSPARSTTAPARRGAHPPRLARLLRGRDLRPRDRPRLHHHRRPPLRPRHRRGPRLRRADEPADPLRRGPDEPGQLRDDEPRRRRGDDPRRARRHQRRWSARPPPRPASRRELIFEAVIVGNPVMHHLLLGIDPVELGQAPVRARHRRRADALGRGDRAAPAPGRPHLHPALHRRPRRRRRRRRRALRGARTSPTS